MKGFTTPGAFLAYESKQLPGNKPLKIGFVGAGQMAQALAAGIQSANNETEFLISDPSQTAIDAFCSRLGGQANVTNCQTNDEVGASSDVLFLSIKPQFLDEACSGFQKAKDHQPLTISIVAGASISDLCQLTGLNRMFRVMPNTPCLVNQGVSALAVGDDANSADVDLAMRLLEPIGLVRQVPESYLDAVTGLSGSGPAYVFTFIEALSDGGVLNGLPRSVATEFAIQTVLGAAELVKQSGDHTGVLRDRVASPGGTTIAGLAKLEEKGLRSAVISAVKAATDRSRELGQR